MAGERLNRVISRAGLASRRGADKLIKDGHVRVNGKLVREPGTSVDLATDEVRVQGKALPPLEEPAYLLVNKPREMISSTKDPEGRATVLDLLDDAELKALRLYPVGRLDWDSEGLLVLTNDGELANRLMHPRYGIERCYESRVRGKPQERVLQRLKRGVRLDDGWAKAREVEIVRHTEKNTWLRIVVGEGRNRMVRRMLQAVGHPVVRLRRVAIGPLSDDKLRPGQWRHLGASELIELRRACGLKARPERFG